MVGKQFIWLEWISMSYFEDVQLSDVYKLVREKVEKDRPELASKMTSNLGFVEIYHIEIWRHVQYVYSRTALGIEFRESTIAITSKCNVKAKKGTTKDFQGEHDANIIEL